MTDTLKRAILRKGSVIGVVTPSWAGPDACPTVFELGLRMLAENFDLKLKEYPSTRISKEDSYLNPAKRAEDVMLAFEDPETDLIITSIGGNDSIRILPYLDMERIKKNPKPFMGFSDTTTLLLHLNQHGLITVHGPSVMAGFAEPEGLPTDLVTQVKNFFFEAWDTFEYKNYSAWTETEMSWSDPAFFDLKKTYSKNEGWKVIQGRGKISGKLYGGNLEIFEMMKGTPFMESLDHLDGALLFLETSEDVPSSTYVKYALRSMGMRGVFDKVSGILFGRLKGYTEGQKSKLYKTVQKLISEEFGKTNLPIVTDMDFGHTQPQWILPLGAEAEVDLESKTFRVLKNPFH